MNRVDAHDEAVAAVVAVARERLDGQPEAELVIELIRQYYARVAVEDLVSRDPRDLYGAVMSHWSLGRRRPAGQPLVRLSNPDADEHGWQSPHTVVEVVTDDLPFLVDSVTMVLTRHGCGLHLVIHPILAVERDADGVVVSLHGSTSESWMHIEVDQRTSPAERAGLRDEILSVLRDVRVAVEDWGAMRAQAVAVADDLAADPPPVDPARLAEAEGLLCWLADDHFTFLGYREYELVKIDGADGLAGIPGTGLGLLRDEVRAPSAHRLDELGAEVRDHARDRDPLIVTRASSRSTVHRPDYLAYVGVKRFGPGGEVTGERRFLGLYTALTYRASAMDVPFLRSKVEAVLSRSGLPRNSHSGRELWNILETFPRDELFHIGVPELTEIATGILGLQERKQVRLFVHRDEYERFVSCLVFVPRDRYSTTIVERMEAVLVDAYGGVAAEHDTFISESVLARVHFLIRLAPDRPTDVDTAEVERRLVAVSRWWADDLRDALVDGFGEDHGLALLARYEDAFPASYREACTPRQAVGDIRRIEALDPAAEPVTALHHPVEAPAHELRFKLYTSRVVTLSSVLPLLEHLGVEVTDERPFELHPDGRAQVWLYDIGIRGAVGAPLDDEAVRGEFQRTFTALWCGDAEPDLFNRLVLAARLRTAEVTVLRAYAKYLRQAGTTFSLAYMAQALARHADITRKLIDLFVARFDPAFHGHRTLEAAGIATEIRHDLDEVESLDDDRILRAFLHLAEATTRTNAFCREPDGRYRPVLACKIDSAKVPDLPLPRPMFEIWVYSPRVEGVHLRGGPVARGGIRWSDRREDFRTEILGLMKAQMVKNAVIVPVGAKGGFVVKQPPGQADALRDEVAACYRMFIGGLLDVTDNVEGGEVVPPPDVVRHDRDDPYLVVAADKGTATFSDLANAVAAERGFWLGDAFASGGSDGYDHKAMGITARGAWESVRRHFRTLGVDADTAPVTCVGIGDMSGDVFGNGLLLSRHLRLVAAFDHRHVFLDPDPDPAASYAERARLFALGRSSWDDYDRHALSAGGGVFPRTVKAIPLTDPVRERLGIEARVLTPSELISAILRAPVDLLWNGGIGTYVKGAEERNADVGDRANDAVRVNGRELRCRVVAEGGNLGLTQQGRVEFALAGGLVNTDAIDNSAGVDCSDHEVNLKILLDTVVADGDLTAKQRNHLLVDVTDDVARLVLEDNVAQNLALAIARAQAAPMVDVHARYVRSLELEGLLDRDLEGLPTVQEFAQRQAAGQGLTGPEFAVLLAYTKTTNITEVLASDLPDDAYVQPTLLAYFPAAIAERFAARIPEHRLRREILATRLVNEMVNRAGTSFDHRMTEETGAGVADITRCHLAAADVIDLPGQWDEITALGATVPSDVQIGLYIELRRLVERAVLWLLRHRRPPLDIGVTVEQFRPGAAELTHRLPELLVGHKAEGVSEVAAMLEAAGVPADLTRRSASWHLLHTCFDVVEVAGARGRTPVDVASVYWMLVDRLHLAWLWDRIAFLPRNDRWKAQARAALRSDLLGELRTLTDDVLRAGDVFSPPEELVGLWLEANGRAVARTRKVHEEIRSSGTFDLATLTVALRQLGNLVLSSAPRT